MKIIGIAANAGHGKDATASVLLDLLPSAYRRALADRLKVEVMRFYPQAPYMQVQFDKRGRISYPNEDTTSPSEAAMRRRIWQVHGTEWKRRLDPLYWVKEWQAWCFEDHARLAIEDRIWLIPDIRFINEAKAFQDIGAKILFIDRGDFTRPGVDYTHGSEAEVRSIKPLSDHIIHNEAYLPDLVEKVQIFGHRFLP